MAATEAPTQMREGLQQIHQGTQQIRHILGSALAARPTPLARRRPPSGLNRASEPPCRTATYPMTE
eukprot:3222739-Pyramimonas_sp.AAC.1